MFLEKGGEDSLFFYLWVFLVTHPSFSSFSFSFSFSFPPSLAHRRTSFLKLFESHGYWCRLVDPIITMTISNNFIYYQTRKSSIVRDASRELFVLACFEGSWVTPK